MHAWSIRIAALLLLIGSVTALADELSDFTGAVERAASHQRVAIAYLRTGNVDLAALEIDRLRQAWAAVTSLKRPAALNRDPQLYTTTMVDVATRLVGVSIMMDSGRSENARQGLQAIRAQLTALRKANGIEVLADCIAEANATMDRLMAFNDEALDWSKQAEAVAQSGTAYRGQVDRCDAMADQTIRVAPEFGGWSTAYAIRSASSRKQFPRRTPTCCGAFLARCARSITFWRSDTASVGRALAALLFMTMLAFPPVARAAELIMFHDVHCVWCARFDAEIGPIYAKTKEGRRAPLAAGRCCQAGAVWSLHSSTPSGSRRCSC